MLVVLSTKVEQLLLFWSHCLHSITALAGRSVLRAVQHRRILSFFAVAKTLPHSASISRLKEHQARDHIRGTTQTTISRNEVYVYQQKPFEGDANNPAVLKVGRVVRNLTRKTPNALPLTPSPSRP